MQRQLRQDGGIMDLSPVPRENFGLGSKLKRTIRKIIPNEVAEVAVKAAPFVAPFNPAVAAAMAGIGSFDQTGRIGSSLKRGALTYGGGQLARFIGGAGFQQNPFTQGGAFRGGLEGFKGGFSSPLGTETGLKLGKSNTVQSKPVEGVKSIDQSALIETQAAEAPVTVGEMEAFNKIGVEAASGDSILDKGFDLIKKGGKEFFYKDGKLDKTAVIAAVSGAASYAEALALAKDAGTEITEEEYDEAKKAEKKAEYAGYLETFFDSKKDGGRIGFSKGGSRVTQLFKLLEEAETAGDDDKIREIKSDLFKEFNLKLAKGGRIGFARGTDKDSDEIEEFKQLISGDIIENEDPDMRDMDDLMAGGGISFSRQEKSFLFRKLGGSGGSERSYTMPQLYRILNSPNSPNNIGDARILKEIAVIGLGGGRKDGGRIGFRKGSPKNLVGIETLKLGEYDMEGFRDKDKFNTLTFGSDDLKALSQALDYGELSDLSDRQKEKIRERILLSRAGIIDATEFEKEIGIKLNEAQKKFLKTVTPDKTINKIFLDEEGDFRKGIQLGRKLGEDAFFFGQKTPTLTSMDYNKLGDEYIKEQKEAVQQRINLLRDFDRKNYLNFKMGGEVPVRKNKVGIEELDYRQSGGFVPVGVKEKADDVPAMLSKNEFVMTADAVRGIGGGDVDKGAEKLYNVMKQAEKVGRA